MQKFRVHIPTELYFGEEFSGAFAQSALTLGKKALLVTGGGSIEKLGYLAQVTAILKEAGIESHHFSGIEPNPHAATINKAAAEAKQHNVEFVIALGGGSVMDASKAIAALLHSGETDIWQFVLGEPKAFQLTGALPIVAIPTTAATASEVTLFSVISNPSVNGKSTLAYEFLKPTVAWLNPAFTVKLSPATTRDGAADIFSHVIENYLLGGNDSDLADRYSESVIATVIETLPKLLNDPENVSYRADLLWASSLALNGFQLVGRNPAQFVLHSMEHAASGFYPDLAHGRGLATLYPAYFRWLWDNNRGRERFAKLARRIFLVQESDDHTAGLLFIEKFEQWLDSVGLYQSFPSLGITEEKYQAIADYAVKVYGDGKQLEALGALTAADIVSIFQATAKQGIQEAVAV